MKTFGNYLYEMAIIGRTSLNSKGAIYEIRVYHEPLSNPSFHVIAPKNEEFVLQWKDLEILEWKKGKPRIIIKKEFNMLKNFFLSNHPNLNIPYWKYFQDLVIVLPHTQ